MVWIMKTNYTVFNLIKASIWGTKAEEVKFEDYEEMRLHAIQILPARLLSTLVMPEQLRIKWQKDILQKLAFYANYKYVQDNLPLQVPYVVLKGQTAAQYYPNPEYRIMGDIDIMTKREDYDIAYQQLLANGFKIIKEIEREVSFQKNGMVIELHRFFASLNDPAQSQYLDDLIIDNINASHILPDMINGLVLLEHISQHLEHGLGLRQIIDWMLFVNKCLSDEKWPDFAKMADRIGLKKLAIVASGMCKRYLGLPEQKWYRDVDASICDHLMEYIMSCGNFGNKWNNDNDVSQAVFSYIRRPIAAIKWFQERGMVNWKAAQKNPALRPFAWVYQLIRYIIKGFQQEGSSETIKKEYREAQKRMRLFDDLGVKQKAKGLVVYRNGKYVKK